MNSTLRVTGVVTAVRTISGSSDRGPWAFRIVTVLIAGRGLVEVRLAASGDDAPDAPARGDFVDWLVEATTFRDRLQVSYVDVYPTQEDHDADDLAAVLAHG